MSDEAIEQQLRRIKKSIIKCLKNADYDLIQGDNNPLCVIGARDTEWRAIRGDIKTSISKHLIKQLEKFPVPEGKTVKKELWLRGLSERKFYKLFWNNNKKIWEDKQGRRVKIY